VSRSQRSTTIGHAMGAFAIGLVLALVSPNWALAQAIGLPELSDASRECVECHKKISTGLYQMWGDSKHYRAYVGCYECHAAEKADTDSYRHYNHTIATIVSPKDCARCHSKEVEEFVSSHHAKAGRILGSLDNVLAEIVEGDRGLITPGFPGGNAASAVMGCWQCHGSQVKALPDGKLDPATWPNTGIGRINPDGSEGSCSACHARHKFSAAQARHPNNCGKCHMGPDHPQKEIYEESKHGIAFAADIDDMNLDNAKWIVGEDYYVAPTCATCHMSATKDQVVTHDVGMRISWNNRPPLSVRPEKSDAKMGLPGKDVPWQVRRQNMKNVCLNCHNQVWIDNFYIQYDGLIKLYNEKFAAPGKELITAAKPLREHAMNFTSPVDWYWWELWHHEGRRARHGASMMGPDYTHWHGTYDVAKTFYTHLIPELRKMVEKGLKSSDAAQVAGAKKLQAKLDEVLHRSEHAWFIGKMDPEEAARRKQAAEEFKARYQD